MSDVVHECEHRVTGTDGTEYRPRVLAEPRGTVWVGWIEFVPRTGGETLRTREETSQPTRDDVVYWATGLEPVYLEGALARAR